MFKYIKYLFYSFLIICTNLSFAQDKLLLDSLQKELKKTNLKAQQILLLIEIGKVYQETDIKKADSCYQIALSESKKNKFYKGIALSIHYFGTLKILEGKAHDGIEYFLKSAKISDSLNEKKILSITYNNIGLAYSNLGNYSLSEEYLLMSLALNQDLLNYHNMLISINNLGVTYLKMGNFKKALECFYKSLKISDSIKDQRGMAYSYKNIASAHENVKDYKKALEYLKTGIEKIKQLKKDGEFALFLNQLGKTYIRLGDTTNAYKALKKAYAIVKKNGYETEKAWCAIYIAEINEIKKKYEIAIQHYFLGLEIFEKNKVNEAIAFTYKNIGLCYIKVYDYSKAYFYLKKAENYAHDLKNLDILCEVFLGLSYYYSNQNQYQKAWEYHIKHKKYFDSIQSKENLWRISQTENYIELSKLEKQKAIEQYHSDILHKAEIQKQGIISKVFLISFLLMFLFATFILRNYRRKKKINQLLTEQNYEIEKQKEEILAQKTELQAINQALANHNDYIRSNINYAQSIQDSILPNQSLITKYFENFIIYFPKDIVSGDFYWFSVVNPEINKSKKTTAFVGVFDCTGHSVSGAFMSMIGFRLLNEIIYEKEIFETDKILSVLDESIVRTLKQNKPENYDGMDACLCKIEFDTSDSYDVYFSGAKRPLLYYKKSENTIEKIKGANRSTGGYKYHSNLISFDTKHIKLNKGDILFLTSDGFIDQNAPDRKKFGSTKLKNTLLTHINESMEIQKNKIIEAFENHKQNEDLRDDITLIGIKL